MNNLELYEKVRIVPEIAQKEIKGGRLKGMTDINPMWRIKTLTEQFGVCGFGWYTEIVRSWTENGHDGEMVVNIEINLYVKRDNEWSKPIKGVGGSRLISKESNSLHTDDECYKKAYTDALSVACKALGIGADVYFSKDKTKYDIPEDKDEKDDKSKQKTTQAPKLQSKYSIIRDLAKSKNITSADIDIWLEQSFGKVMKINDLSDGQFQALKGAIEKGMGNAQ